MLLKDLISRGRELLSAVYPEGETSEIVFAYLEDVFGIRRYDHLLNPDYVLRQSFGRR